MTTHDVIVIGSGIGGMTAAGLLAGVAGKKVLVLEKHTEPGGLTHVFRRDGASWDVGLHYVGEVAPGSQGRAFFDYLSGGELRWTRMPERFERFVYPGIDISVPSDPVAYERLLIDLFPAEPPAIRRYFKDIQRATRWSILGFMRSMVPRPVERVLRAIQRLTGRLAKRTTGEVLAARFRSAELRAVLASQWGDYGLPPSQSAFAIHAQIVSHYLRGASYPEGGAARIARTFEKGIERSGGSILVGQEVLEILTDGGRAVGVRVLSRRGPMPVERIYRAPIVISSAGAFNTVERLLPTEGEIGTRTAALRQEIRALSGGLSAVTLYLRLNANPRCIGVQGENHWINTRFDHDDTAGQSRGVLEGSPCSIYVSFPSIKAKDEQFHTAEVIAFVDESHFAEWRDQPKGNRGAAYSALKQRIGDGLLKLADAHIPGLAALVSYTELSTPLTVEHYTSHTGGRFYGLAATPIRYRSTLLAPRTPIDGLYLAGQDAACLGIFGAMMGGLGAACQVLGAKGFPMIQAAIKAGPLRTPSAVLPPHKKRAVLVAKRPLTPSIWHLEFEVSGSIEGYAPGQFARLHVGGDEWRDYSIAGLEGQRVLFLISTRTKGHGSRFAHEASVGTATEIELPLGQYTFEQTGRRPVFIATGTGLAPFLPMFESLERDGGLEEAVLMFGYRMRDEDITAEAKALPRRVIRCVSRDDAPADGYRGRVTEALQEFGFFWKPRTSTFVDHRPWWPMAGGCSKPAARNICIRRASDGEERPAGVSARVSSETMPPSLQGLLDAHAPADAAEALSLAEMRQLQPRLDQPLSRHQSKAHFTASALVVDVEAVNIALLHHAKLRRWLQPGGHAEPGDGGLTHATALREARGDEPAHHHLDLRFLMVAEDPQRLTLNADESSAVGWFGFDEAHRARRRRGVEAVDPERGTRPLFPGDRRN